MTTSPLTKAITALLRSEEAHEPSGDGPVRAYRRHTYGVLAIAVRHPRLFALLTALVVR